MADKDNDITSDLMDKLKPFATAAKYVGDLVTGTKTPAPKQTAPVDTKSLADRNQAYADQQKAARSSSNVTHTNENRVEGLKKLTAPAKPKGGK